MKSRCQTEVSRCVARLFFSCGIVAFGVVATPQWPLWDPIGAKAIRVAVKVTSNLGDEVMRWRGIHSMSVEGSSVFANPPVVEAVVDIDCDLPADVELGGLEKRARERYADKYPGFRRRLRQHPRVAAGDVGEATSAFQFLSGDERQLVQIRLGGFSFNRFAPYTNLDDYLPEIERTWGIYAGLVSPLAICQIRLRFINRIVLPADDGFVDLSEYLRLCPKVPEALSLELTSVLNQYTAVEPATGNEANVRMVIEQQDRLPLTPLRQSPPVIVDIAGINRRSFDPRIWENVEATIRALHRMVNTIFWGSLTQRCLDLFR